MASYMQISFSFKTKPGSRRCFKIFTFEMHCLFMAVVIFKVTSGLLKQADFINFSVSVKLLHKHIIRVSINACISSMNFSSLSHCR